jgi:aspartyl-tRNA(Asn)/glutamyl-tRNA(Gln) amidotransferase subunit A
MFLVKGKKFTSFTRRTGDSLSNLPLQEASQLLKEGKITSISLVDSCIAKMKELQPLNAFVSIEDEVILKNKANDYDSKRKSGHNVGLLGGIPVAIKDNYNLMGKHTTCASKMLQNYVSTYTATVVDRLEIDGGIIMGNTNMDEFAMGSLNTFSVYGPCANPLLKDENGYSFAAGGSSGGSAVAVASFQCFAALGSDTGGSVRLPAAWCNIYGLKPTYGLCSRYGMISYASSLDTPGILARTVDDCALILSIIGGSDKNDANCTAREKQNYMNYRKGKSISQMTIGVPAEYNTVELPEEIRQTWVRTILHLEAQGATIKSISLPHTKYALPAYYIIACAEASSNLARYDGVRYGHSSTAKSENFHEMITLARDEGFGEEVKRRILLGTFVLSQSEYEEFFIKSAKIRHLIADDFIKSFKEVDLILTPTTTGDPPKLKENPSNPADVFLNDIMTVTSNLAGVPAMNIPLLTQQGKPCGVQLMADRFNEEIIFFVADALKDLNRF